MPPSHPPKPSPLALPAHLRRPMLSQASSHSSAHSISSVRSVPHAQQHEYVPIFEGETLGDGGLGERAMFEEASSTPQAEAQPSTPLHESWASGGAAPGDDSGEWPHLYPRDGSISRRPAWRRPRLAWVYPFIVGAALSMGMGMAPKSELMINLACLAHPPQRDTAGVNASMSMSNMPSLQRIEPKQNAWYALPGTTAAIGRPSAPTLPVVDSDSGNNGTVPWSPADRWFLKLQHEMYEYRLAHQHHNDHDRDHDGKSSTPSKTPMPKPSSGIPQPTSPLPRPDPQIPGPEAPSTPDTSDPKDGRPGDVPVPTGDDDDRDHTPFHAIDPRTCKKDPKVQAAAARLTMIMTLTMGLLSAITTGYWGQKSDKLGRTKIIAIVETSLLVNEVCFILVATFPYLAPGGYRSLLIGPLVEGLLGGFSTLSATINAYISDVTPDGSRVTAYARLTGISMCGFAVGPVLGSLVITATGNIMAPFYINVVIHTIYIPLILFVLPESLSSDARLVLSHNRALAKEVKKRRDAAEREWESETPAEAGLHHPPGQETDEVSPLLRTVTRKLSMHNLAAQSKGGKKVYGNLRRLARKLRKPIDPLAIFLPREREDGGRGKDWNLTAVGVGIFFLAMILGVLQTKAQYAFYAYGWTSAQLGPYMSIIAFSRSFVLIVLVPLVMHFVKPRFFKDEKPHHIAAADTDNAIESGFTITSSTSSSPSLTGGASQPPAISGSAGPGSGSKTPEKRSAALDLWTVRICLLIEVIPYFILTLGTSATGFVLLSALMTFGSPSTPAANSLALALIPDSSQTGRLFGGIAVVHAIGATLVSPLLFGNVFAATVGWYAPTIFALATGSLVLAQVSFAFVNLHKEKGAGREERGRSRKVKRVASTSTAGGGRSGFVGP